jgi:polygalacturonase
MQSSSTGKLARGRRAGLPGVVAAVSLLAAACSDSGKIAKFEYTCGNSEEATFKFRGDPAVEADPSRACGYGDLNLPPEPRLPLDTEICQTLTANKSFPDENNLDTQAIQAALTACKNTTGSYDAPYANRVVRLVADGPNNVFVASRLNLDSVVLWVDAGVTLYASRDPKLYQRTGNCGVLGVNDSNACNEFITARGTWPGVVGEGVIDGQGGEPIVGHDYSWWQMSGALRSVDGSIGNPTLVLVANALGFLAYRITLHNSPKFHLKLASRPVGGTCNQRGDGFVVWGITVLTPSRWFNSQGLLMTPLFSRNSDAIDPGSYGRCECGILACNTISTGDDHIVLKGGHHVSEVTIAHNHFGTGHGMSIGSETYGVDGQGVGVENVDIYDLTIDSDSRWTGAAAGTAPGEGDATGGENGIRIKSDISRGGVVRNIHYSDVCMRDVANAVIVTPGYNAMFAGGQPPPSNPTGWPTTIPQYKDISFRNIRSVTCLAERQPAVQLRGFSAAYPLGPVQLDNVVIDNIGPEAVAAEWANLQLGPGDVNFAPYLSGPGLTVTSSVVPGSSTPHECKFAPLPVPERPEGWLW